MADEAQKQGLLEALWSRFASGEAQPVLDAAAMGTMFTPVVGDVVGLGADAYRFATQPEERTPLNFGLAALGALPFIPPLGMLRKGGREDLMPWHGTDVGSLRSVMADRKELYSPSIGVSKDTIPGTWANGHDAVTLVPKVGAFDPSTYPTTLFNRDAYTPRKEWYEGFQDRLDMEHGINLQEALDAGETLESIRRTETGFRNADRYRGGAGLKGLERESFWSPDSPLDKGPTLSSLVDEVGSVPQAVSIKGSPAFRSFETFERHPLGAKLLDKRYADWEGPELYAKYNNDQLDKFFPGTDVYDSLQLGNSLVDYDRMRAAKGGREALLQAVEEAGGLAGISVPQSMIDAVTENPQDFLRSLDKYNNALVKSPSGYAELKASGPIPVNSEHWAGAMFPQGFPDQPLSGVDTRAKLAEALLGQGIPSASAWLPPGARKDPYAASALRFQLADELQKAAGHARRSPL